MTPEPSRAIVTEPELQRLRRIEAVVRETLKLHWDCLCRDRRKAFEEAIAPVKQ